MLTRLTLENFKAWRDVGLPLGKITGLFGTNSSGKSSLLQFLLLLKQTRNATDRKLVLDLGGPGDLVNLGTFKDAVHRNDESKRIRWRVKWTSPKVLKINELQGRSSGLELQGTSLSTYCEVGWRKNQPTAHKMGYHFSRSDFWVERGVDGGTRFDLKAHLKEKSEFNFIKNVGYPGRIRAPIKTHLFPDGVRNFFQNTGFLAQFESAYENMMDSIYYLGPLRQHPQREYRWGGSTPDGVGESGERTLEAILAATREEWREGLGFKKKGKSFQEMLSYWLKELRLIHDFRIEEIAQGTNLYRAKVKTTKDSAETALTDIGFGVSQVLPALVLLYYVPKGSVVLMEQPEIHLHPSVQSGFADVMLNVAKNRDVQIIVESHSEHLIRRLQRRVAEGKASSEDVKLYFVSSEHGEAKASDLVLNEYGEIENWPPHFFGDEMGEIAAIMKASLKKRENLERIG